MYKIRVVQSGKEFSYEPGASLLEILLAQNILIIRVMEKVYVENVKYALYLAMQGKYRLQSCDS